VASKTDESGASKGVRSAEQTLRRASDPGMRAARGYTARRKSAVTANWNRSLRRRRAKKNIVSRAVTSDPPRREEWRASAQERERRLGEAE
jgi:orotidine-5'-phosphate decarboxylase